MDRRTGRGRSWIRGPVCGLMTTAGGIGHTMPFLIHDFRIAWTVATIVLVLLELIIISAIRHRYMETPWIPAVVQVVMIGGALVFVAGILESETPGQCSASRNPDHSASGRSGPRQVRGRRPRRLRVAAG